MRAFILAAALAATVPAASADDELFRAMSMLAMGSGLPEVLPPTLQEGNYVDLRLSGVTSFGDTISPGPTPCSLIHTSATQDRGEWVQMSVKVYDFSKIAAVRYLGPQDDFATSPSRQPDDPAVDSINLDGKGWHCQRVMHLDPAKPYFAQFCDDSWTITVIGDADRKSAREAVEMVGKACFAK